LKKRGRGEKQVRQGKGRKRGTEFEKKGGGPYFLPGFRGCEGEKKKKQWGGKGKKGRRR